jgi:pimeloyl-ACP methyl ester carboxylesterase
MHQVLQLTHIADDGNILYRQPFYVMGGNVMSYITNLGMTYVKRKAPVKKIIIISAIVLAVLIIAGLVAIPPIVMNDMTHLHVDCETQSPSKYGVEAAEVGLATEDGFRLASWEVEAEDPRGIVIFLSGIHNPSVTSFFGHAKMLADNGYSSLLIEMRSHGKSEGDQIFVGTREYLDTKAGVQYIKSKKGYENVPVIVFGVSMGGATAINSIGEIPEIDGLISISAFSSWPDAFCDNMELMGVPSFIAAMEKPFVKIYMGFEYGFGSLRISPVNEIKKLNGRPTLLMHSTDDTQMPYKSFVRLNKAAPGQFDTFIRKGDYHFICREECFEEPWTDEEYSNAILSFLKKNF